MCSCGDRENGDDGRPHVYEVRCPACGHLNAAAANGSFNYFRCKNKGCKRWFSGLMVDGDFVPCEKMARQQPFMQVGPPTAIGSLT